jgi:hypothetical protein
MSGKINTREFSINDYDAAVELWNESSMSRSPRGMTEKALLNLSRGTWG